MKYFFKPLKIKKQGTVPQLPVRVSDTKILIHQYSFI